MRIAISGTHCSGKSTLIEQFLLAHPEFAHEPEAYQALQEEYGEAFAAEPTAEDFLQQLEFNIDRLRHYGPADNVIFERSPADYVAYMLALHDLGRDPFASSVIKTSLALAKNATSLLDFIVFLPASDLPADVADAEDPELRIAVDSRLESILIDDDFGWLDSKNLLVVKASGTMPQRLHTIESGLISVT